MPHFNPLANVTGRNAYTLFDIRLDNDFIVFRGNDHESSGQLLKGTLVLCLPAPLRIEDVHLRLLGTERLNWTDARITPTGISNQKVDRNQTFYDHRWPNFIGGKGKTIVLDKGNYEWPFELMLPGDFCESIEGMPEASITYHLKATVARGKLAYDLHAKKRLRIIRTLESSALEFLHAMSVENIWPNKVEYSIVIPQKAVVFGSSIPLETRFTPLLKGLKIGEINCKLMEVHEIVLTTPTGHTVREHKREREVKHWALSINHDEHWNDMIDDSGQEGWVLNTDLDLPKKLGKCMQDTNVHGIKIRHKLKLVVALHNPDGHVSELRATLPVTIFISPNMPLDEDGNLVRQAPHETATVQRMVGIAPPGYGEHILDQLYDDVDMNGLSSGLQTPAIQSGVNTPFYALSRAGSAENLHHMGGYQAVPPAALSSRLQDVSLAAGDRNSSYNSLNGASLRDGATTPHSTHAPTDSNHNSPPHSAPLSRSHSGEDYSGINTPEHLEFEELNKVPSYSTAVKTPVRPLSTMEGTALPDYNMAVSAPNSPTITTAHVSNPLDSIPEVRTSDADQAPTSLGFSNLLRHHHNDGIEDDVRRRLHLLQARAQTPY
ncbi:hypothetical protein M406DRAFT_342285 [Cryphonectria parasitica EP155]|uniref:Arrestin C-terminal-like domain-containing protein n=1 Tax=Cryphonectria parasitica (strain ATCC 38755 / EP155) TaxID=660469 RepID=A0A9P4XVD7_CRYP1|nr:uncharacterized protein M406DRAFT_342285 [Cryphonectria parasitica EP155]KAF3761501.1 hypothetical protein M406DRAFT_342285 [Cryphonectria parasitica EP155]